MNKIKQLVTLSIAVLFMANVSVYAADNTVAMPSAKAPVVVPATPQAPATSKIAIHSVDSGAVMFSNVKVTKRKGGYKVTGDTKLRTSQRRVLKMPGYIMVTLKAADGSELESIKAKFHRKYGASKVGHFEAMLKTTPPAGSQITVEHINK